MQPRASTRLAFLLACLTAGPWASAQAPPKQPGPEANTPGEGKPLRPLPRSKNAREIRALIRSLGDAKFEVREGARDRLYQIGEEAVPYLERATEDGDAERATAAGELLEALDEALVPSTRKGRWELELTDPEAVLAALP